MAGLVFGLGGKYASRAAASGAGEPTAQTDDSVPARGVTMLGASPAEAPGETWGIGQVGSQGAPTYAVVRYSSDGGWTLAPGLLDNAGQPLSAFQPAPGPLPGEMTSTGDGALLGILTTTRTKVLLTRKPGGSFQETAPIPNEGEGGLEPGEELFGNNRAPLVAALDEGGGAAGALVVPVNATSGMEDGVLHWSGTAWTREPIELPKASKEEGGFRVLSIAASSPQNAWLLAQLSSSSRDVALFRRKESRWQEVTPAPLKVNGVQFSVRGTGEPPGASAQILTVTDQGVWVDGERTDATAAVTMFVKPGEGPEGEPQGEEQASWCNVPTSFPACDHTVPDQLPTDRRGASRGPTPRPRRRMANA